MTQQQAGKDIAYPMDRFGSYVTSIHAGGFRKIFRVRSFLDDVEWLNKTSKVMKMIPAEKFNKPEPPADSEFLRLLRISEFFHFI